MDGGITEERADGTAACLVAGRMIAGVALRPLAVHEDARGSFTEIFSRAWGDLPQPAQWSLVRSAAGVLRGMHLHRGHDEGFCLVEGAAHVGLHDLRPGSPTEGAACLLAFTGDRPVALTFPRGIVHGWCFTVPSWHVQSVTATFCAYGPDDNLGCHWSDPALGLDWPAPPTILAPRAAAFPSLAALRRETLARDPGFRYRG
jgi:dTDP-4-dehydrorhamnose 3,5-epimerase